MEGFIIVSSQQILIPIERILKEYEHMNGYLSESQLQVKDLVELSFSITGLAQSFDLRPRVGWSTLAVMSDYFIAHRPNAQHELTDEEAIRIHHLTALAGEIHDRVMDMVGQYHPMPNYGYHEIRRWVGNNILIEPFR